MHRIPAIVCATLVASSLAAQNPIVVPPALAAAEGSGATTLPWGRGSRPVRAQYVYDAGNFGPATAPLLISRLRWRADGGAVSAGGTYDPVTIELSTGARAYNALSSLYDANHGADRAVVHRGPVVAGPTSGATPNDFYVDVPLATPFRYDPAAGPLVVDLDCLTVTFTGGAPAPLDGQTAAVGRVVGTGPERGQVQPDFGAVLELTHVAIAAGFTASPRAGAVPLTVQFTDTSATTAPGGLAAWAWDFDNDGTVDSTLRNPTHTYATCGDFDVSLTVADGVNPPATLVETGFVHAGVVNPSFAVAFHSAPHTYRFTDTTTPGATAWAWDFDNDGTVDSTQQHPLYVAPSACHITEVALTATNDCRTATTVESTFLSPRPAAVGTLQGGAVDFSGTVVGHLFDVDVLSPGGLAVCGLVMGNTLDGQHDVEVYLTEDTHVGKAAAPSAWRLVSAGSALALVGGPGATLDVGLTPFHVPAGRYGVAVFTSRPGAPIVLPGTDPAAANPAPPYANADVVIHAGGVGSACDARFGGSLTPSLWNGGFYYGTCGQTHAGAYGFFATGCAGTMGTPTLSAGAVPRLGQGMSVAVAGLPLDLAVMVSGAGLSNSSFGPLPLDLTVIGAPGCLVRVEPYAVELLVGVGGAAAWTWSVPADPALLCLPFYNQAFVPDPAANPLGAVMSDAAGGVLGL